MTTTISKNGDFYAQKRDSNGIIYYYVTASVYIHYCLQHYNLVGIAYVEVWNSIATVDPSFSRPTFKYFLYNRMDDKIFEKRISDADITVSNNNQFTFVKNTNRYHLFGSLLDHDTVDSLISWIEEMNINDKISDLHIKDSISTVVSVSFTFSDPSIATLVKLRWL